MPAVAAHDAESDGLENRLLAALPAAALAALRPHLRAVDLPAGRRLIEPGDRVRAAYFPSAGALAVLMLMEDGTPVEVFTVGREGFVDVSCLLSVDASLYEVLCLTDVAALQITVPALRAAFRESAPVRDLLLRYAGVALGCTGRSIGCKAAHTVEQRLARWLLMARDRMETETLPLTHEVLGHLLGVQRATVTAAAHGLRDRGLIRYHRGQIAITDRAGLEGATCEDYWTYVEEYERLLGPGGRPRTP
jgi:CRP-like cAMP-binding protein